MQSAHQCVIAYLNQDISILMDRKNQSSTWEINRFSVKIAAVFTHELLNGFIRVLISPYENYT